MESFWATRLPSSIVIYCKRTFILREICHNSQPAGCVPPVVESFPCPLGHPVKHRDMCSLSYLGRRRFALRRRRECENLEREAAELNGALRFHPLLLNEGASADKTRRSGRRPDLRAAARFRTAFPLIFYISDWKLAQML